MEAQDIDSDWTLPIIDLRRCVGCGICVQRCPTQAVALFEQRAVIVHPERCTFCEVCEQYCPHSAIARPFVVRFAPSEGLVRKENR
jgi:ferredoxin